MAICSALSELRIDPQPSILGSLFDSEIDVVHPVVISYSGGKTEAVWSVSTGFADMTIDFF